MQFKDKDLDSCLVPIYGSRSMRELIPKYEMPKGEMSPEVAYDVVTDQLMLDGNSRLNLATFVTTWMEPKADQLMQTTFSKNMIDKDEYPQTAEIEERCIMILARLWNADNLENVIGCSTVGSSEACMLAGLALKWKWRNKMKKMGCDTQKPNLVIGINAQVCWEKFCMYWDVEMRAALMEEGSYTLTAEKISTLCDENTIGVVAILGSTFTGEYEPVEQIHNELMKVNAEKNLSIEMHVDAASGGMVAPFLQPNLKWDFKLPLVRSINTSGHKYGLVYPGVGWAIWKDKSDIDKNLIFNVNYLGGNMPTFALNFSRPGSQIIAQYYNFIRLGMDGYKRIHLACQEVALYLSSEIRKMGIFKIIHKGDCIPVVSWRLCEQHLEDYDLFELSDRLRMTGWQIPAYSLARNLQHVVVMRIVVKEGLSMELAELLINDMKKAIDYFTSGKGKKSALFHH